MEKNNNVTFGAMGALCVGVSLGLIGTTFAPYYVSSSNGEDYRKRYPSTYAGRYAIYGEEGMVSHTSFLYIVRYRDLYYLVDENLKVMGGDIQFTIVDDESLCGKSYQILSNDVILFQTIWQYDDDLVNLDAAYDLLDSCDIVFPDKFEEITYPLNVNCCEVAFNYANQMKQENVQGSYRLSDLYAIYFKGNVYLCTKIGMDCFAVVYDGEDYQYNTITFSLSGSSSQNYILVDQVKKVSSLLAKVGIFEDFSRTFSINEVYDLLSATFHIIDNPFQAREYNSRRGFTKDQVQTESKKLGAAYQYLDDYQIDWYQCPISYSSGDLKLVRYFNQYFIVEDICYSDEMGCYFVYPIHSSNNISYFSFSDVQSLEVMRFDHIAYKMLGENFHMEASAYYQALSDYLIQYGDPFSNLDLKNDLLDLEETIKPVPFMEPEYIDPVPSTEQEYIEPAIQELGKRLNLKLEYEQNM